MTDSAELTTVPSVSLATSDGDPDRFAQAIGRSFERFGFAVVADHGIPAELIARAEAAAKAFFALPEDVKRRYFVEGGGGQRGYTPFRVETAKDATEADLKEFWHIGRDLPPGHRFEADMPANIWPEGGCGFPCRPADAVRRARYRRPAHPLRDRALSGSRSAVLRRCGGGRQFDPCACSIIRRSAPMRPASAPARMRTSTPSPCCWARRKAACNCSTRDGRWLAVDIAPGEMVVNIGDMLQRLTNGKLPSTSHRVMNPPPERRGFARYSMPFFLHFRPDYLIETLPQTISADRPDAFPEPITANDYLLQRLREIKLI